MGGSHLVYGAVLKVPVLLLLKGQRENKGYYITGLYSDSHEGQRVRFGFPCVSVCVCSVLSFLENHFLVIETRGKVKNWEGATFQKSCSQLFCITFLRFLYLFFLFVFSVCTFLSS